VCNRVCNQYPRSAVPVGVNSSYRGMIGASTFAPVPRYGPVTVLRAKHTIRKSVSSVLPNYHLAAAVIRPENYTAVHPIDEIVQTIRILCMFWY